MNRTFQTRFTLTFDDFRALAGAYSRLTPARRFGRHLSTFMIGMTIAGVGFALWVLNNPQYAFFFAVIAALLLVIQFVGTPWQQRRTFDQQRLDDFEVEMTANEEGISSHSELAEGKMKWSAIHYVNDLENHVILWPNNRMGWIVPKRAFGTSADAEAFAQLAKEKTAGQKL